MFRISICTLMAFLCLSPSLFARESLHSSAFVRNSGQVTDQHGNPRTDIDYRISANGVSLFVGQARLLYQWAKPEGVLVKNEDTLTRFTLYRMDVALLGADPHAVSLPSEQQPSYERYYLPAVPGGAIAPSYSRVTYRNVYPHIDWVLYRRGNTVEYDFIVHPGGKVSDIRLQYGGATALEIGKSGNLSITTPFGTLEERAPVSYQQEGTSVPTRFVLEGNTLSFATDPYTGTLTIDPLLSWASYYGGAADDNTRWGCVAGDNTGNAYLVGYTTSTANIATVGSYQTSIAAGADAFLVKFNSAGVRQWATYYGGPGTDQGFAVTCDHSHHIYLSGYTSSNSVVTTAGAHQTTLGTAGSSQDALLVKFDSTGARIWATYYGGSSTEQGFAVACDKADNVFLAGYTSGSSTNIATASAHQVTGGGTQDGFLVKFNSAGVRQWGSYYGGATNDRIYALGCDTAQNVFIGGYTMSTTGIATTGAFQPSGAGDMDLMLVKFDSNGVRQWGTYYGGTGMDQGYALVCDPALNVYVTGYTVSTGGISSSNGFQTIYGGGADGMLAKFSASGARLWATYYGGSGTDQGNALSYHAGCLYMAGLTNSTNAIAVAGTMKDTLSGAQNAFVVKFDTAGSRLWGTYFGGDLEENATGIYCNAQSQVYIGGITGSTTGLSTSNAHQTVFGGNNYDAFLARIDDCQLTAPATIAGNDTVCRSGSYTYSITAIPGAISYNWTLPPGWSGASTSDTITIIPGANSDTIRVSATLPCGTTTVQLKPVVVQPLPTISPTGSISLCFGDSIVLSAGTASSWQWLQGNTLIPGATSSSYTVHNSGTYEVVAVSAFGCTDTSSTDTVIVHPLPIPVITATGAVLSVGSYSSYQWNYNGNPITGATASSYTTTISSGSYSVTVTDSNGCTATSADYMPTNGVASIGNATAISVYPNPTTGQLYIPFREPLGLRLYDITGRALLHHSGNSLDISALAAGYYLLCITDKDGLLIKTEKITKQSNR